ncbi:MAG TPA: ATP-binding protein [Solirubrobacteraceae bacterium]|nr:ATP-binding protein [Solirubrobacteraceae bacterium]
MNEWRNLLGSVGLHPGRVRRRVPAVRQAPPLDRAALRAGVATGVEILIVVGLATVAVAALQSTSSDDAGLGSLYLLAVLLIAIRRGQLAALVTGVLGVLALNFFFIAPRHRLAIAYSQDLVELIVLLIAAVVVGRLAAVARERAAEAESRAYVAAAREREAKLVAEVASAILAGESIGAQLDTIGSRVALATAAGRARIVLEPVPTAAPDEITVPLHTRAGNGWLYLTDDVAWDQSAIERVAQSLGRLVDVAVERDRVSERAAETEASRRAEVAKTAILHAISHDLRSPLTAITTAGSTLAIGGVTDAERAELIDVIEAESARLAKLVDDLLDLSRIESGAVAPQADWCDLHDVVASAATHAGHDHAIEFQLPGDLPLVRADAAQLERVFSNLIENAVKFSPAGAPVRISGGASAGRVAVRVADRGSGIPRRYRSQVFEPFFRGRGEAGAGSGLGLAICRGFVEANGGRIILQSGRDTGTSFTVSFPVAQQPADAGPTVKVRG